MTKYIVASDVHIHNHPRHNLFNDPDFRLNQFITLANRLVQIGEQNGADHIILGGDQSHHALVPPEVGHVIREFISILSKGYKTVEYILGNHDINIRSQKPGRKSSILPLLSEFPNVHYMDNQVIQRDGLSWGFSDYRLKQDFTFIEDKVDILVGHVTILPNGQEYDKTKFKVLLAGDIHAHGIVRGTKDGEGHSIKIGVPLQNNLGDQVETNVLLLDTEKDPKEGILSDSPIYIEKLPVITEEFQFLRLMYEDHELYDSSNDYHVAYKRRTVTNEDIRSNITKTVDIYQIIDQVITDNDLNVIHNEVVSNTNDIPDQVDLNFNLLSVEIHNYRSIDDLTLDLSEGVTVFTGHTGSGKSTVVSAIHHALTGIGKLNESIRVDCNEAYVKVELEYLGSKYSITRGVKGGTYVEFYVDGVRDEEAHLKDLRSNIEKRLPFITYMHLMYHYQHRVGFLSDYAYADRIKMMSRAISLDVLEAYSRTSQQLLSKCKSEIPEVNSKIEVTESLMENSISRIRDDITQTEDELVSELESLDKKVDKLQSAVSKIKENDSNIDHVEFLKSSLVEISDESTSMNIDDLHAEVKKYKESINSIEVSGSETKDKLKEMTVKQSKGTQYLESSNKDLDKISKELSSLKESRCYVCDSVVDKEKMESLKSKLTEDSKNITEKREAVEKALERLAVKITDLETSMKESDDRVSELKSRIQDLQNSVFKYDSIMESKAKNDKVKDRIKEYEEKIDESLKKYNLDDIHNKISEMKDKRSSIQRMIYDLQSSNEERSKIDDYKVEINKANTVLKRLQDRQTLLESYASAVGNKGAIISHVFSEVSRELSSDVLNVRAYKTMKSGETRPDFTVDLKVMNSFIPYDQLSGGQKTIADMMILSKMVGISGGCGMLILDETLKYLDPDQTEMVSEIVRESQVSKILISTHASNFTGYDNIIRATLGEDGISKYMTE